MSNYQLFNAKSRQPGDIDQLLLAQVGQDGLEWFLLLESKNMPSEFPVRMSIKIDRKDLSVFFFNREVFVYPDNPETRKLASLFGVTV